MIRHSALWLIAAALLLSGCREASREQASQSAGTTSSGTPSGSTDTTPQSADRSAKQTAADNAEQSDEMTIVLDDCKASRVGKITGGASVLSLLLGGPSKDELVKRGTVLVDEREYVLYLAKSDRYTLTNTGEDDSDLENTSTLISIDQNGDGKLTEDEGWYANLPVRLGDTMFDVTEIAKDGRRIVLKRSKSALSGVIVGRICPPFSFETSEGTEINLQTLAGKAFLLDIWSIT